MTLLTVVILTKNEELHIERAINSVKGIADRTIVVDSGSIDRTVELAQAMGATVLTNAWTNHATQFNWSLDQLPADTQWVMRLDADEYVTPELEREIALRLSTLPADIHGISIGRRMNLLGERVRFGGVFPIRIVRLFQHGHGRCENRWMDEHILVDGATADFAGEIIDDNRKSLTWWTDKHNAYASREVVDLLNLEYGFMASETVADLKGGQQAGIKRWLKEKVYARLPAQLRASIYFFYRFFLRLGFLDTSGGRAFHILQGFWYRYLVDSKLQEVRKHMRDTNKDAKTAIRDVLGIDLQR
jgi:glycosyltransferase involved in cell wall biosynthesis